MTIEERKARLAEINNIRHQLNAEYESLKCQWTGGEMVLIPAIVSNPIKTKGQIVCVVVESTGEFIWVDAFALLPAIQGPVQAMPTPMPVPPGLTDEEFAVPPPSSNPADYF